jgi:hypothetical protein
VLNILLVVWLLFICITCLAHFILFILMY